MQNKVQEWIVQAQKTAFSLWKGKKDDVMDQTQQNDPTFRIHKSIINKISSPGYLEEQIQRRAELVQKYKWENSTLRPKAKYISNSWILKIAAALLIILSISFFMIQQKADKVPTEQVSDLKPGKYDAHIKLGDGSIIDLKENKAFTDKNGNTIYNEDGEISFTSSNRSNSVSIHQLIIPKGGEYCLILPDGTKVWLNSDSKLNFPSSFTGDTREVHLEGEGYFQIAKKPEKPFFVHTEGQQIHATGTEFNIKNYDNEEYLSVILVEGSVEIKSDDKLVAALKPNEQYVYNKQTSSFIKETVDPKQGYAWFKGSFYFKKESLLSIAQKIERWYDAEIIFEDPEIKHYLFTGEIQKYENIDNVMNLLKLTNEINYEIKGRTIHLFMNIQ